MRFSTPAIARQVKAGFPVGRDGGRFPDRARLHADDAGVDPHLRVHRGDQAMHDVRRAGKFSELHGSDRVEETQMPSVDRCYHVGQTFTLQQGLSFAATRSVVMMPAMPVPILLSKASSAIVYRNAAGVSGRADVGLEARDNRGQANGHLQNGRSVVGNS